MGKLAKLTMICAVVLFLGVLYLNFETEANTHKRYPGEIKPLTPGKLSQRNLQRLTYSGDYSLNLRAGKLRLRPLSTPYQGKNHYILQFNDIIQSEWIEELKSLGIVFDSYMPPLAYFISADEAAFQDALGKPYVRLIGEYPLEFKIDPQIGETKPVKTISETGSISEKVESDMFTVILFRDSDIKDVKTWIEEHTGRILSVNQESHTIRAVIRDYTIIEQLAQLDDVLFIEQYFEPQLSLDVSQGIVKSVMPVDVGGFDGTGVLVAVVDTGWDYTHPDFPAGVIALDYTETDTTDGVAEDMHGHGTHTATTVLGRGTAGYSGSWGPFGRIPRGIAPAANLIVQRVFGDTGAWGAGATTVLQLMVDALNLGAHISSNSWGWAWAGGAYDQNCVEADQTVIQGLIEFWAGGNAAAGGIDIPGSAKNVIAVGASENYEQDAWFAFTWPAIDPDRRVGFSSLGYTQDFRVKPDVMAPGSWLLAGRTTLRDPYSYWGASYIEPSRYSCYYAYMGGTSMSTPTASGCGADILEAWGLSTPPSFVKALMINTAECMDNNGDGIPDGFYYYNPNTGAPVLAPYTLPYGWGRLNTMNAIYTTPNHQLWWSVMENAPLQQGYSYCINDFFIPSGWILKVTLVWTDEVGNPAVVPQLVNDLDLQVTDNVLAPTVWWQGNMFDPANPNFSFLNPAGWDAINNVEQVIIQGTGATVDILWWAPSIPGGGTFSRYSLVFSLDYEDPYCPAVVDFNGGAGATEDNHFGVLQAAANQTITVDVYESKGYLGGGMPGTVTLHYSIDGGLDQTIALNGPGGSGIVTYSTNSLDLSTAVNFVDFWVEGADIAGNILYNGGQELNGGTGGYKYRLYVQDLVGPDCRGIDPWPDEVIYTSPTTTATAYIYENVNMGTTVTLNYAVNGGAPQTATLTGPGGKGYMVYTGSIDLSGACSGYIDMWVTGTDTAGNPITVCPVHRNWCHDANPPTVTWVHPANGQTLPNSSMLYVDTTITEDCQMPTTVTLNWLANPNCTPSILLVDDDIGTTTGAHVESYYQNALTAAGFAYTNWDTEVSGSPTAAQMAPYDVVIWFTGFDWWTTLSAADETELSAYISGGGKLFLSSQDYLWDVGLTAFGQNYLRIQSYINDVGANTITGVAGDLISDGVGTLGMSYPFIDFSDQVDPSAAGAQVFLNDWGTPCGIRANDTTTVFFGFPFEVISTASDRSTVMSRVINYLLGNTGTHVTLTGPGGTGGSYTTCALDLSSTSPGDTVVFWITGADDAGNAIAGGSPCAPLATVTIGNGAGVPCTLTLTANPTTIPPDGTSPSIITATVLDSTGIPVPDGTTVTFSTTLGTITPSATTTGGTATATLTSTTSGTATVRAIAWGPGGYCTWGICGTARVRIGWLQAGMPPVRMPSICPLAKYNISLAQNLKEEAEELLTEAQGQGLDTAEIEEIMAKAEEFLETAEQFCKESTNCVAGNWNALKAMELYNQAIDELKKLLGE